MLNVGGGHHRLKVLIGVVDDREANSTLVEAVGDAKQRAWHDV